MEFRPPSDAFPRALSFDFWVGGASTDGRPSTGRMMDDLAFVHDLTAAVIGLW
jgi:hypothetical protein